MVGPLQPDHIDLPDPIDEATVDPHTRRIRHGIEADVAPATEDEVRRARHGYYANTSYVDDWLGRLLATVDEIGRRDDTVVVFTSDHGDMLPTLLDIAGVDRGGVGTDRAGFDRAGFDGVGIDRAGIDGAGAGAGLTGRSLWPAATGAADPVDETTGEYTAEMTSHPMFMIRRGRYKYIHCDTDPPLLYDLAADPLERRNLASDPDQTDRAAAFAAEVKGAGTPTPSVVR